MASPGEGRMAIAIRPAQGIAAVSFFAAGKKDTSGKPGPCAAGAGMRPEFLYPAVEIP
jgi:hypothetical protein